MTKILHRPTLVLNRNWQPINVTTVACALIMLWNESARIVDPEDYELYDWKDWSTQKPACDEPFVQAVTQRIRVPEVVTLTSYDRLPSAAVTISRRNVFKRDHYTCQYCGKQPGSDELTIDHVLPRAQRGESSWSNCVLACLPCNKRKDNRTPEQARMRLRKAPVRPTWKPLYAAQSVWIESWSRFIRRRTGTSCLKRNNNAFPILRSRNHPKGVCWMASQLSKLLDHVRFLARKPKFGSK